MYDKMMVPVMEDQTFFKGSYEKAFFDLAVNQMVPPQ
jgi:hypothetical protein